MGLQTIREIPDARKYFVHTGNSPSPPVLNEMRDLRTGEKSSRSRKHFCFPVFICRVPPSSLWGNEASLCALIHFFLVRAYSCWRCTRRLTQVPRVFQGGVFEAGSSPQPFLNKVCFKVAPIILVLSSKCKPDKPVCRVERLTLGRTEGNGGTISSLEQQLFSFPHGH